MKRILLTACCLLALLLAGCTSVNQTNSFVVLSPSETVGASEAGVVPEAAAASEVTATPEATAAPNATLPPVVPLIVQPTPTPETGEPSPPETPSPQPEGSPGGFNG